MNKFTPMHFTGKYRLKNKNVGLWHWRPRRTIDNHIERMFFRLHYLACHAPKPVQEKWSIAYKAFSKKYHKKL